MRAEFVGQDRISLLGIAKALRSSGDVVMDELKGENYDLILLPITDEEVKGLREFIVHPVEIEMDDLEIIYEYHMKNFGETSIPPEAYISAIKFADERGVEIHGIDIPSGIYEEIFVRDVQLSDILLLSLKKKRLIRRKWEFSDPEQFSIDWDSYITKGGYLKVEKERVKHLASEIVSRKRSNTLAVLEVERFSEVVYDLKNQLPGYRFQENGGGMPEAWSRRLS